jgi:hypothetical protein
MRPSVIGSRPLQVTFAAVLVLVAGCSNQDNPALPSAPEPAASALVTEPGIPIEVREDADQVGVLDAIKLNGASLEGRNIKVSVSYSGGCETHTIRALASTCMRASYPGQVYVYLQHDAAGDDCEKLIREEIAFDVTPLLEFFNIQNPEDRFYIRVITPDAETRPLVLIEP